MLNASSKLEKRKIWGYSHIVAVPAVVLAYIGATFVFLFLAGIGLHVYSFFASGTNSIADLATIFEGSVAGKFAYSLIFYGAMAAIIYALMRKMRITLADVGLGRRPQLKDVNWAVPMFVLYFIAMAIITALVARYLTGIDTQQEQQLGFDKNTQGLGLVLIFIALVVLPPLAEEFVMRGFLWTSLRTRLKIIPAVFITCFIFSIAHLQLGEGAPPLYISAIDTFVLSAFLIYVRVKTGSLWASIFIHAIKNGLAFTALFIFKVS